MEAGQDFRESNPKDKTGTDCKAIMAAAKLVSMKRCLGEKSVYVREQVSKFSGNGC